ncbi:receptor-type tyrosine-protein phosphatase N2 [Synchiropus picturatus]
MDPRLLLTALAVSLLCSSPAVADRKYGCLFEDELCTTYEFCVNDGVFGRCQELAGADLYTYDISSSGLQRLRTLLQKLAHRGLTWQDDITQQVISRELSKLRSIPSRHQGVDRSPYSSYSSSRKLKPERAEHDRNLHQYLTDLGYMPRAPFAGKPEVFEEDAQNDDQVEMSQPKPKQGWKETTIYSVHKGDGQPPVTKVFSKSGEGRHPKLSTAYSDDDAEQNKLLSSHLEKLFAGAPGAQRGGTDMESAWPKGKLYYLNQIHPMLSDHEKEPLPNIDKLLMKEDSNRMIAKKPPSMMDEQLLHHVMKQLGSSSNNMDSLMGTNFGQLEELITGALQEVNSKQVVSQAQETGAPDSPVDHKVYKATFTNDKLPPDQSPKSEKWQKETQRFQKQGQLQDGVNKEPPHKPPAFFSKLLDYLNLEPFDEVPSSVSGPPGQGDLHKMVGLENVQSRTTQGQVPVSHGWEQKSDSVPAEQGATLRLTSSAGGPDAQVDSEIEKWMKGIQAPAALKQPEEAEKKNMKIKTQLVHVGVKEFSSRGKDRHFGYIITGSDSLTTGQGLDLMERLTQRLKLHAADLTQLSVLGPALTFRLGSNPDNVSTADLVQVAVEQKQQLEKETGLKIVEAGVSDRGSLTQIPVVKETRVESGQFVLLSVLCMLFILVALAVSAAIFCIRQRSHLHMKEKLASLGTDTSTDATATYQELCRQRMAIRTSERVERPETLRHSRLNSVSSQFSDGPAASPSTRSSTSSWCEEPVPSNMDISTGHMILSYMEDHLKNKNRLEREWEALCSYQAEPSGCRVGRSDPNHKKNRSDSVVVYDHSRITLKAENNHGNADYINASPIMDHDPRNPTYIASQGPLPSTVPDFWQMVWESGCVVIVMLTPLSENGVKQCHHYWPDEGSDVYHIYEVNLVSEHIWCEDFLVRSFYLKNLQTNETRTVTQFHFLSWMDRGIPSSARTLLDFRRKVNKCYRGRSCPIIIHCSDGAGRSGTYILIDMVLNRMAKGAKEIDIAATLEHLRDQRAGMVQTKEQFEFALTAVAEEVNAILKALPQ